MQPSASARRCGRPTTAHGSCRRGAGSSPRRGRTRSSRTGRSLRMPCRRSSRVAPGRRARGQRLARRPRLPGRVPAAARDAAACRGSPRSAELNVRTYVRAGRRPGVWFFSLDTPSTARCRDGQARLPAALEHVPARARASGGLASSLGGAGRGRASAARASPRGLPEPALPGTLEHFLIERYCLYGRRGRAASAPSCTTVRGASSRAIGGVDLNTMAPRRARRTEPPLRPCGRLAGRRSLWALEDVCVSPQRRTALVSVVAAARADRDQARHRPRERQPRPRLGGAALGHRPRRRAADVLRRRRRRPPRRRGAPVRPRQGRAPRRAGRGGVPRRSSASASRRSRSRGSSAGSSRDVEAAWWAFAARSAS